ncbi:MAG: penicillin-binding protein 2 [Spirochaetaceae bacterium]|nr:penicillin-binding protein 2 [Spirochaetaceae bacterium]
MFRFVKLSFVKNRRKLIVVGGFVLAFLILFFRFSYLALGNNVNRQTVNIPVVQRGAILDRHGRLLAEQLPSFTISLWLPELRSAIRGESSEELELRLRQTATAFSLLTLIPADELYNRINSNGNNLILARRVDVNLRNQFIEVAHRFNISGLRIESEFIRFYPAGSLAANLLGYVNYDNHGGAGIEFSFESLLSPAVIGGSRPMVSGSSIELTIDAGLQGIVENRVKQSFMTHNARSAVAVIADANTGAILSFVSLPTFDSNLFHLATNDERFNRVSGEAFEPGSTFKVFSLAAIMDAGLVNPTELFFCGGVYEHTLPNGERITIRCANNQGHGWQNIEQILSNSCNVGTAQISEKIGSIALHRYLTDFGFGRPTGLPLAGETAGLLANPRNWSVRSKPTIAIGQEVAASAIQIIQAATVFSNNGEMLRPQIINRIIDGEGVVTRNFEREVIRRVVEPQTAASMLTMLRHGVTDGIARRTLVEGLEVGAKTGTSQIFDFDLGTYSRHEHIASALAFVPAINPEFIIYIAIDRPTATTFWGATVVAPLVREVILDLIPFAGLNANGVAHHILPREITINRPVLAARRSYLPDFTSFNSVNNILAFGQHHNINIVLHNHNLGGQIVGQFPPAGTILAPNTSVAIYFSEDSLPLS